MLHLTNTTPFKKRANAAAHGSAEDLSFLFEGIRFGIPRYCIPLLLPAFYSSLDPVEIPTILDRLDSPRNVEPIGLRITRTLVGLRAIAALSMVQGIPPAAFVDLWLRIWRWIEFLDTYRDHLPGADILSDTPTYIMYLALFRLFQRDDEAFRLIETSAGVYAVVGRAWSLLFRAHDTAAEDGSFDEVCDFLALSSGLTQQDPAIFEDLVFGTGGTRTDIASLVVLHIRRVLPNPDSTVTEATLSQLSGIENILIREWDDAFREALLSEGIVRALTIASRALGCSTWPRAEILLNSLFSALVMALRSFPSHRWIPESLRAGLLLVICSYGSNSESKLDDEPSEQIEIFLAYLLQNLLPPSTLYYSVLSQLRHSIAAVHERDAAQTFRKSTLFEHWVHFLNLVEDRMHVVGQYNAGILTATRGCDNLEVS